MRLFFWHLKVFIAVFWLWKILFWNKKVLEKSWPGLGFTLMFEIRWWTRGAGSTCSEETKTDGCINSRITAKNPFKKIKKQSDFIWGIKARRTKRSSWNKHSKAKQVPSFWSPWANSTLRAQKTSRLKLRRGHRDEQWPGPLLFSWYPGPEPVLLEDPQRTHPKTPHVGLLETRHCSSESCSWTAPSTCKDAVSLWPTHPGRVRNSDAEMVKMAVCWQHY